MQRLKKMDNKKATIQIEMPKNRQSMWLKINKNNKVCAVHKLAQ